LLPIATHKALTSLIWASKSFCNLSFCTFLALGNVGVVSTYQVFDIFALRRQDSTLANQTYTQININAQHTFNLLLQG
jgi:hypothetical protein